MAGVTAGAKQRGVTRLRREAATARRSSAQRWRDTCCRAEWRPERGNGAKVILGKRSEIRSQGDLRVCLRNTLNARKRGGERGRQGIPAATVGRAGGVRHAVCDGRDAARSRVRDVPQAPGTGRYNPHGGYTTPR